MRIDTYACAKCGSMVRNVHDGKCPLCGGTAKFYATEDTEQCAGCEALRQENALLKRSLMLLTHPKDEE